MLHIARMSGIFIFKAAPLILRIGRGSDTLRQYTYNVYVLAPYNNRYQQYIRTRYSGFRISCPLIRKLYRLRSRLPRGVDAVHLFKNTDVSCAYAMLACVVDVNSCGERSVFLLFVFL